MKKSELEARIEELVARVAELERKVGYRQMWVTPIASPTVTPVDCGCPTSNWLCNNVACPRSTKVFS